jgi:hypothetical protein
MKNKISRHNRGMLLVMAVLFSAFLAGGVSQLRADDWGGHQRYYDRDGFYDGQRHYHQYDHYRDHRGYWDQRNGVRIFINVGG